MRARIPSPSALQATCGSCHQDAPALGSLPSDARVLVEWIAATRDRLELMQPLIEREADDISRRVCWAAFDRAANRVDDAVAAMHAFDLSLVRAELMLAREALVTIEQRMRTARGRQVF